MDALSRLPLPVHEHCIQPPARMLILEGAYSQVLLASVVTKTTTRRPVLAKLREYLWSGAGVHEPELELYKARSTQLSVQEN